MAGQATPGPWELGAAGMVALTTGEPQPQPPLPLPRWPWWWWPGVGRQVARVVRVPLLRLCWDR